MNEKELRKLRRQDLLQLLLLQSREANKLEEELETLRQTNRTLEESRDRLTEKLDGKDEQILWMQHKLDALDQELERLRAAPVRAYDDSGGQIPLETVLSAVRDSLRSLFFQTKAGTEAIRPEPPPDKPAPEPTPAASNRILQSLSDPNRLENNTQGTEKQTEIEKTDQIQGGTS